MKLHLLYSKVHAVEVTAQKEYKRLAHSLDMDMVLVFLLMLVLPHHTSSRCYSKCPDEHFKTRDCSAEKGNHTATENSMSLCARCRTCSHTEVVIKPCNSTSNVECDCKEDYYKQKSGFCVMCTFHNFNMERENLDFIRKCQPCQRKECLSDPQCKKRCAESTDPHSFMTSSTATTTRNSTSKDGLKSETAPWLFLWVVLVITVALSMLLLLHLIRSRTRKPNVPCWRANKGLELPAMEQCSHRDSGVATLTLNITEETPMMDLSHCPVLSGLPAAHISPLLPNVEQKAVRQDELSGHWPAVVLYAIIKEVPLRRWKEFLRLLSVADQQLERVELEAGLGSMEKQYQILRLWSQRSSASLTEVFSTLHYMGLSGCAQLLQEHLEKLQWTSEPKHGFTA